MEPREPRRPPRASVGDGQETDGRPDGTAVRIDAPDRNRTGGSGPPGGVEKPRRVETMWSPRKGSPSRPVRDRSLAVWAALAMGWVLPTTGCQVEYAGMTLPSGKYMHDDVQYFAPGPDFPWSNTQAATQ